MIVNYYVKDSGNIGDDLSSPAHYFNFKGLKCRQVDQQELQTGGIASEDKVVIVGGGGLLADWNKRTFSALKGQRNGRLLVLWGAGQQGYCPTRKSFSDFPYSDYLSSFDLIGLRDWGSPFSWVPCASCMHPLFDQSYEIQHEYVVYSHHKFKVECSRSLGLPYMENLQDNFREVLRFLGSGETVITSSFHGSYWATLLGRNVIALPFSTKFFGLRHEPKILEDVSWSLRSIRDWLYRRKHKRYATRIQRADWLQSLGETRSYPSSLEKCRAANTAFFETVMQRVKEVL